MKQCAKGERAWGEKIGGLCCGGRKLGEPILYEAVC